jgi:glycerophosphoryl diester phosphodiesterase
MTALPQAFLTRPLAHRGLHDVAAGRPENSLPAFRAAIGAGYGIELDLQLSSDGVAMVFHDYDLQRLTGQLGPVAGKTAAQLGQIALLGDSEGIPTLAQVLDLVAGQVPLLIEVKDQDLRLGPKIGALEAATVQALHGYAGPIALMSFNPHSVLRLAELAPEFPRGLTTCDYDAEDWHLVPADRRAALSTIPDFDRTGCCFISHQRDQLTNPHVTDLKARGVTVLCWTIRSPAQEADARKVADNITFEGYHPT